MGLLEIGKGALWLTGKTLQGTAWLTSKMIEGATGVDLYGSAKELFTSETDQSFGETNQERVLLKKKEYARKRAEILKKNLPNLSDEYLLNYEYEKFLCSYREVEVYMHELSRRGLTIYDSSFNDFVETMKEEQRADEETERELHSERIQREYKKEELERERLLNDSLQKKHQEEEMKASNKITSSQHSVSNGKKVNNSQYSKLSNDELMRFDFTKLKSYDEILIYMDELNRRYLKRTDNDFGHYRSAMKKKKLREQNEEGKRDLE